MPELENVMYNYMQCSYMMIGPKVRYCVTYKNDSRGFNIFRAKYVHNFKVNVQKDNLEGSKILELESINGFVVTTKAGISLYDCSDFMKVGALPITLLESTEREPNEVLTVTKCQNEEYLAVLSGKNLIMAEQKVNQLWIFKKKYNQGQRDSYEQHKRIIVKDMPEFGKTSL